MPTIDRLQAYLRTIARRWETEIVLPPFSIFINFLRDSVYSNYAIPSGPVGGDLGGPLAAVSALFTEHRRLPRVEYIHEFAPDLAAALRAAGWAEHARIQLMRCTPASYRPAPDVPGLTLDEVGPDTPLAIVRAMIDLQRQVFEPDSAAPAGDGDARQLLDALGAGRSFLAWLDGQPVGAGSYNPPIDRIAEVAGIATLEPYRRRGIAAAVTARATRAAFDQGVDLAFLTAADARAGRVYERVGYQPYATVLAFVAPGAAPSAAP